MAAFYNYSAGADRVAASLGGGGLKATGSNPGMQDRAKWLFWESHERVNGRMLQKNDLECIWQGSLPTGKYCEPIDGIPGRMKASVEFYLNDLYDNLKMLAEEQHDEKDVYFYHSDHLGSANWITDGSGIPVQHLQYLPFGEPFVDQHPAGYQERFRFTGKERDEETGYGYFGARYMDHELTAMWLSVDPMADKYPSISPYAYCAWNPVILIDPDGMKFDSVSQIEVNKLKKQATLNWYKGYKGDIVSALNQSEYNSTLNEITKLELSNQWYHITKHDGDFLVKGKWKAAGWTHYLLEPNVVEIEYNGTLGTLSHECKHAFQFDIGSLSFDETGDWSGSLYDFFDEKEAYVRGAAFGRKSLSEDEIKKKYNYPPMTYTTINSEPSNPNRSIEAIVNAKKNIYRKNGDTYKAGIKVTN